MNKKGALDMEKKQAKEKSEKETKRTGIRGRLSGKKNKELSKEWLASSSEELASKPRTKGIPDFKIIDPMNLKDRKQKEAYDNVISRIKSSDYSLKAVNKPDIQSKPAGKAHHQSLESLVSESSRQVKEASKEVPKEAQKAFSSNERSRV
jgi:hypothetical protein